MLRATYGKRRDRHLRARIDAAERHARDPSRRERSVRLRRPVEHRGSPRGRSLDPDPDNNEDTETGSVRHACFPAACISNGSLLLAVNPEGYLGVADEPVRLRGLAASAFISAQPETTR